MNGPLLSYTLHLSHYFYPTPTLGVPLDKWPPHCYEEVDVQVRHLMLQQVLNLLATIHNNGFKDDLSLWGCFEGEGCCVHLLRYQHTHTHTPTHTIHPSIHPYAVCTPLATRGRSGTGQEVMLNMISCYNVFDGYEDPVDEIIACKTDTWTLMAEYVVCVCG